MKKVIAYFITIIFILTIVPSGCKNEIDVSNLSDGNSDVLYTPSGTITPLPSPTPTKEPTLTPVPKIKDLFDHRIIETIEKGDLFSFGTRDWGKEVSKTPDENFEFIWKVVDFTGTEAVLVLNEDFGIVRGRKQNQNFSCI